MMVDDFLIDPVMAARLLLGLHFDAFQAAAFRLAWWVPNVIDESGFGTGKSLRLWALLQLRCMLIEDQWCCAYYQTFEAGKSIFWPNYTSRFAANPFFRAQLGKVDFEGEKDGKDNTHGPACYVQNFKNGSRVMMPAPNWMQNAIGQAGLTLSVAVIDEWTKVETMGKKTTTTLNNQGVATGGINQQILGRLRRASFNQHHPLWGNHCVFSATAESTNHPSQQRVAQFLKEIARGNPNYAIISFNFKDASNLKSETGKPFKEQIINWKTIENMKSQFTRSHFMRECLGIRVRETKGWYTEEDLERCTLTGIKNGLEPECMRTGAAGLTPILGRPIPAPGMVEARHTFYFMGIDPAPAQGKKADDGAKVVLRVRPKPGIENPTSNLSDWLCEFVWAYCLRKADVRQWSGFIHQKHRHFALAGMLMDSQGGGQWINLELVKGRQLIEGVETEAMPIASFDDINVVNAQFILTMYRRSDPALKQLWPHLAGDDNLYEAMHVVMQEAVTYQIVSFPKPFNERPAAETEAWSEEQKWALKNLDAVRHQLMNIQVSMREDGTWATTRNGAKTFSSGGKKDLAYAAIFAYVRFLVWLKMGELEFIEGGGGDDWGSLLA